MKYELIIRYYYLLFT